MARQCPAFILIAMSLVCALSAWGENVPHRVVTETPVTFPENINLDTVTVSPDGRHLAFVQTVDGKECANIDGVLGKGYTEIRAPWERTLSDNTTSYTGFFYSPDSKHCAYMARQDESWYIVVDGQQGAGYTNLDMPLFSPTGGHVAYKARKNEQWCMVVDGKEGKGYEAIGADEDLLGVRSGDYLLFNADGTHFAYVAVQKAESLAETGVSCVVWDNTESAAFDHVSDLTFSQDGKHLAYAAEKNRETFIILDRQEVASYAAAGCPVLSAHGERLAYLASMNKQKFFVVIDGLPGKAYESVKPVILSPDGKHYYYVAQDGDRQCLVCDGLEGPLYSQVFPPSFSPDGKHLVNIAVEGNQWCVAKDEAPGPSFDAIWTPVFSADSAHLAYVARVGEQTTVVLDQQPGMGVTGLITDLQFTPDGKHLLYEARDTSGKTLPVTIAMDNRAGHLYEKLLPHADNVPHVFLDGSVAFHYFAEKNHTIYKVEEQID